MSDQVRPEAPDLESPRPVALPSAGWWRRLLATLVDMVVFCAASVVLAAPVVRPLDLARAGRSFEALVQAVSLPSWQSHAAGLLGLWIGLWWGYFVLGWGLAGATPGKWLLGLRVVDHQERCPIGLARAMLRIVAYCVSSVTLGGGHLLLLVRHDRRALHDVLAGTRVVRWRRGRRSRVDKGGLLPAPDPAPDPGPDRLGGGIDSCSSLARATGPGPRTVPLGMTADALYRNGNGRRSLDGHGAPR